MSAADSHSTVNGFAAQVASNSTARGFYSHDESPNGEASGSGQDGTCCESTDTADPLTGTTIDQFRIKSVLASGGMGTVYLAWQQHPVQRNVALKTIRRGMANESTLNRFLLERQTLALLDHPDIARVYDAGTTPDGNPYFAMEYCDGVPIDQYCDDRRLGIEDRIELVIRVARAVQRAHSRGIVHRDLKPGNILVADCEGRPNLKIIDFGIAKFTDENEFSDVFDTHAESATKLGELIGTPAFMSPEQAAGKSIDGRTDVFAIGAILFKLLTSTAPLSEPEHATDSLAEVISHICSFEAIPPSRRLAQLDDTLRRQQAERMGFASSNQLVAVLKGDLDWVTLRAIEPDKLRRYATADDLADDLERFARHEPVAAAAPSRLYQLRKLYQRRKPAVLAVAAITATVTITLLIGGVSWWSAQQKRLATVAQISDEANHLLEDAESARLRAADGGPASAREFVNAQTAVAKVESLIEREAGLDCIHQRLAETKSRITADQSALHLAKRLDDARERATQVGSRLDDAFGKQAGLARLAEAFRDFGIDPVVTSASETARRLLECPRSVRRKLIEALDFLLNEEPIGAGIFLYGQGGRLTIAECVVGGGAAQTGLLQTGDRLLAIDGVDLVQSFPSGEALSKAYQLLSQSPGTTVNVTFVRGLEDPAQCRVTCGGAAAYWAKDVLQRLDPDPWRMQLRTAVLTSDLDTLRELAKSEALNSQPPFSLIQLSGTLFLLERSNKSIELLSIAQSQHPANFWANHYLGTALAVAHDPPRPAESLRYLTAAVSLRPSSVGARMNLSEGFSRIGDKQNAMIHARAAAQLAPGYQPLQDRINQQRAQAPRVEQEKEGVSGAYVDQVDFTIEQVEQRARALAAEGERDAALAQIRAGESAFPNAPEMRRAKGIVLLDLQDYVAARMVLSDAARLAPSDAAARFYHGVALQYSGDSQSAIHEYEAALQLRPDYTAVLEFLAPLRAAQSSIKP